MSKIKVQNVPNSQKERPTGHRLPRQSNLMQDELDLLVRYTESHLMAINRAKTKALLCNSRIKWDFLPELNLGTEENIEVVEELKIVGYIFRSDMKTCSNTAYLTAKAYKRMWFLRRLKALGANTSQLLDTLEKQVMFVLWLGAPAWFCQLTQAEKRDFDRVAKVALRIIYGDQYESFENALLWSKTLRPSERLEKMTKQFAARSYKHRKFNQWFSSLPDSSVNTRSSKHRQKLAEVPSRTERFQNSPIPHMTNILNTLFPVSHSHRNSYTSS
jgi:hypothetical protein